MVLLVISIALLLDTLFGEPTRYHPLVGFGNCANQVEQRLNSNPNSSMAFVYGLTALIILLIPLSLSGYFIDSALGQYGWIFSVVVVYSAIGFKSLLEHSKRVFNTLPKSSLNGSIDDDNHQARHAVSLMVSRDTGQMSEAEITSATIESSLENGCDSTFGVLFWFLVGGAPMVICYRLTNTLDAMWGYRNQRFELFGKSIAKLDDLLNYVPARITALFYALSGNTRHALHCWRTQARLLASPNGGPVMTSGAGSLNIQLGGPAYYHGKLLDKPLFGTNIKPQPDDILAPNKLLSVALFCWWAAIALIIVSRLLFEG
ncbi:MAG: cobalamin biosynthesis protein CobD [Arenicella sp.]|nr:cobalamin biosynthesis protein CobD [Arenicella sp.]